MKKFIFFILFIASNMFSQNKRVVYIFDFEFKNVPKKLKRAYNQALGSVLAAEFQGETRNIKFIVPYTYTNLKKQLKVEEVKQLLSCGDKKCLVKIIENFVGQELISYSSPDKSPELYYWMREKKNAQAEVDYVVSISNKIIPIEVKSKKHRGKSINIFLKEKKNSSFGIIFSNQNYMSLS